MPSKRPNIVFCHVDQLHYRSMSVLGCADVSTPNIDRIHQDGKAFLRAQSTNPICCPARTCWYTGRMPSENGVLYNGKPYDLLPEIPDLGQWMTPRGYDCFYAGKWHVTGRDVEKSFQVIYPHFPFGERADEDLAQAVDSFLAKPRSSEKPFFLSVGFLNPHDCCYLDINPVALATKLGIESHLDLPPLPPDYDPKKPLASPVAANWTPAEVSLYRYYYYRLCERVDAAVGRVYDAVRRLPDADNTIFIFAADHGEMMAHRNRFKKAVLYEPSLRVPLIFVQPGKIAAGSHDNEHIIGGVDVTATILDCAGIEPMPHMNFARSMKPFLGGAEADWHPYVAAESIYEGPKQSFRAGKYKSIYHLDDHTMELYDTEADPYEQKNLADEQAFASVRQEHDGYRKDYESKIIPSDIYLKTLQEKPASDDASNV